MANEQNLTPFKKGNPGGPGRKPKLPALDELLADVLGEEKDGLNAMGAILKALRAKASKGDIQAAKVLLEYGYGKPKETIQQNINMQTPVIVDWRTRKQKEADGEDSPI